MMARQVLLYFFCTVYGLAAQGIIWNISGAGPPIGFPIDQFKFRVAMGFKDVPARLLTAWRGQAIAQNMCMGFNINILTIDRVSPLHEACLGGHVSCAKVLLESGARVNIVTVDGITPLYNACICGSAACVSMLLEYGADPEMETQMVFPLHEAVIRGHRKCAEILIVYGLDINKEVRNLGTPLFLACVHQRTDCVRKLLELGANVDCGKQRDTPLHAAARQSSGEIAKMLIDYGANVKCKNADGKYPVELAEPRSPVEQVLLFGEGPATLTQLCRLCVRKWLGSSCLKVVPRLHLPDRLEQYLLYR